MIQTIWHSEKDEILERVKASVVSKGGSSKDEQEEHREFLGQWKHYYHKLTL